MFSVELEVKRKTEWSENTARSRKGSMHVSLQHDRRKWELVSRPDSELFGVGATVGEEALDASSEGTA